MLKETAPTATTAAAAPAITQGRGPRRCSCARPARPAAGLRPLPGRPPAPARKPLGRRRLPGPACLADNGGAAGRGRLRGVNTKADHPTGHVHRADRRVRQASAQPLPRGQLGRRSLRSSAAFSPVRRNAFSLPHCGAPEVDGADPRVMADCDPVTTSPIQTATATLHTNRGDIKIASVRKPRTQDRRQLRGPGSRHQGVLDRERVRRSVRPVLRRRGLPPGHQRLHDSGRRPDRHRPRRPGLQVRRRVPPRTAVRQALPVGDGQCRPGHQRLAVLHHRRPDAAPEPQAHDLRRGDRAPTHNKSSTRSPRPRPTATTVPPSRSSSSRSPSPDPFLPASAQNATRAACRRTDTHPRTAGSREN